MKTWRFAGHAPRRPDSPSPIFHCHMPRPLPPRSSLEMKSMPSERIPGQLAGCCPGPWLGTLAWDAMRACSSSFNQLRHSKLDTAQPPTPLLSCP
eukprot:1140819-Pelagomonas_calceolata.AAC.1